MNLPVWKYLPASWAHRLAPLGLSYYAKRMPEEIPQWHSFNWKGLYFPNPLGIAGGVDKNAEYLPIWQKLGVGFIEVGTVTPYAQNSNRGKIVDRDWEGKNLWNRMGFPNHGSDEVYFNLRQEKPNLKVPVFVNIGKNRSRSNDEAEVDYLYLMNRFQPVADAFVINVSSPNTQGLRQLQSPEFLGNLIFQIQKAGNQRPLLVKLSPDMDPQNFQECIEASSQGGASGFILTNTTTYRPAGSPFPKEGGMSGKDLAELSKQHLIRANEILSSRRKDFLLVSVGGVLSADDVKERLSLGADLVQTYSGLVFDGPQFFRNVAQRLQ